MLRLPKLTDYAVVILASLAEGAGGTAAVLADKAGLPAPSVAKILKKLARAELVTAQRGSGGGYRLARAAESITVADIVAAMDGPVALTQCVEGHHESCGMSSRCAMRGQWDVINRQVRGVLEGVSLRDMTRLRQEAPARQARDMEHSSAFVQERTV